MNISPQPIAVPGTPLPSREVRWYFKGPAQAQGELLRWFGQVRPSQVDRPAWTPRKDGEPDVYLLLPDRDDMGIKWREGELQIKGRVSVPGATVFEGGHQGSVDRWIKWSYAGMPAAFRELFHAKGNGLRRIAVAKKRVLRKIHLRAQGGPEEVPASTKVDRGMAMEITELVVDGERYCSLAFEAFPDDSGLETEFAPVVSAFVASLAGVTLSLGNSLSFPAWLNQLPD